MHIVHITPRFLPAVGGCEFHVYNLSRLLVEYGHKVTIIATDSLNFNHPRRLDLVPPFLISDYSPPPPRYQTIDGIEVRRVQVLINMPGAIITRDLGKCLKSLDADVYNLHGFVSNISWHAASLLLREGKKVILTTHDITIAENLPILYRKLWTMYSIILAGVLCKVHVIVTQNYEDKERILFICRSLGTEPTVVTIHNGVDVMFFDPSKVTKTEIEEFKRKFNLEQFESILIFVGRVERRKCIDLLIKALAYLVHRLNFKSIGLLIVGPDYGEMNRLLTLAKILRVEDHVIFTGKLSLSELRVAYAASDIFVSLSAQEAFGLSAVEAMAMGKPVIAHKWKGLKDIIIDGVTGLQVEPFNYVELAIKVYELLNNKSMYLKLSQNAYKISREKFGLDVMVRKYLKLYEVLSKR